jgi:hypothetical protein
MFPEFKNNFSTIIVLLMRNKESQFSGEKLFDEINF